MATITAPRRIDVHHHILPQEYLKVVAEYGVLDAGGIAFPAWSTAAALSTMDRYGIATAITSIAAPGVHFGNRPAGQSLARRCNELSARLVADYPGRFGAFASVPLPDVDESLEEITYALDMLHLDGVVMLTSIGERYLGDPAFAAVFDELNRRKAVVFIHPTVPPSSRNIQTGVPGAVVEFTFDTTRTVTSLIYSGTLERCPDIKFILSHAGGTAPYLAWRIAMGSVDPKLSEKAPQGAIAYLKRLYYDTALSANPYTFGALRELVDPSHILFGSDYPYVPESLLREETAGLDSYQGFEPDVRAAIDRGNALALFPRLQNIAPSRAAA